MLAQTLGKLPEVPGLQVPAPRVVPAPLQPSKYYVDAVAAGRRITLSQAETETAAINARHRRAAH